MKRVHWHWTAGGYGVVPIEADSYHEVITEDGTAHAGVPVEQNEPPLVNGAYAAHTLNANSYAIGIACDAMHGARERPLRWGSHPLTEAQIETMLDRTAHYCREYGIPVSRETTLSHAEIEATLGIGQRAKWDFMVLPGDTEPRDPVEVGDELRRRLKAKLDASEPAPVSSGKKPTTSKTEKTIGGAVAALIALVVGYFAIGG